MTQTCSYSPKLPSVESSSTAVVSTSAVVITSVASSVGSTMSSSGTTSSSTSPVSISVISGAASSAVKSPDPDISSPSSVLFITFRIKSTPKMTAATARTAIKIGQIS